MEPPNLQPQEKRIKYFYKAVPYDTCIVSFDVETSSGFVFVLLAICIWGRQMKQDNMGGACCTHE
jgi:hypothetical protein